MPVRIHPATRLWRVPGDPAALFDLVVRVEDWPRWWGSVHERSCPQAGSAAPGPSGAVELTSHARTPLRLRWTLACAWARRPQACAFWIGGDLDGQVQWHFATEGPYAIAESVWRVRARGGVLRSLARLTSPLMRYELDWALHQGELGARLEARRRLAVTAHERASIPYLAPPAWIRPARASEPGVPAPTARRA